MTTTQIIEYYGYPAEIHSVTTEDGYILEMHRIPYGKNGIYTDNPSENNTRPVFFLQHGLLASSADWIVNLPNQSAADAGFDVWLGNVRGNVYSTGHVKYSRKDKAYWEFSWDEMAEYDLETMITNILHITEQRSLYYMAHSQGTEIMFAKLSSDPKFSKKIRKFYALAPISTITHVHGLLSFIGKYFGNYLWIIKRIFGSHEFMPKTWLTTQFAKILCGKSFTNILCENVMFQIGGPNAKQLNTTRLAVYLTHTPAGTSTWNIIHWAQMYIRKKLQKYEYDTPEENRKHYGQDTPPVYNLTKITVPTYLYYSDKDWLADGDDIKESIINAIPKEYIKVNAQLTNYDHFDFIYGINAAIDIYQEVIRTASEHNRQIYSFNNNKKKLIFLSKNNL